MTEASRVCAVCTESLLPIVIMDQYQPMGDMQGLQYRQADDTRSFWTGKYSTAGPVHAFMCSRCGRIELYAGSKPDA